MIGQVTSKQLEIIAANDTSRLRKKWKQYHRARQIADEVGDPERLAELDAQAAALREEAECLDDLHDHLRDL
jgi:hypothetical protein